MLDLTSLKQAVDALNRSLDISVSELEALDPKIAEAVRAGVIQQFEVAYELCWKFVQRWVRTNDAEASGQPRTRKELFRTAARLGLVSDPAPWFEFGDARNLTTHTYNNLQAELTCEIARRLLPHAVALVKALESRSD